MNYLHMTTSDTISNHLVVFSAYQQPQGTCKGDVAKVYVCVCLAKVMSGVCTRVFRKGHVRCMYACLQFYLYAYTLIERAFFVNTYHGVALSPNMCECARLKCKSNYISVCMHVRSYTHKGTHACVQIPGCSGVFIISRIYVAILHALHEKPHAVNIHSHTYAYVHMQLAKALEHDFGAFVGLVMPYILHTLDTGDGVEELIYGNRDGLKTECVQHVACPKHVCRRAQRHSLHSSIFMSFTCVYCV